ncbi:MAG: hypothetical protein RJB39_741, partial [Candidatus Parcubacteria bacterium]
MNISELNPEEKPNLQVFKDTEYPAVDKTHYGDNPPVWTDEVFTLVAKEGDEIVGFIRINVRMGIAYMESLLVGERFRNRGIGQKLVLDAEKNQKVWVHIRSGLKQVRRGGQKDFMRDWD